MKRIILTLSLYIMGLVPSFAAPPKDTVRAVFDYLVDYEKLIFTLKDGDEKLKVRLGGKHKDTAPEFNALDVRKGDTLTVVGKRKKSELVSAVVLGIDYAFDHDDKLAYYFSLDKDPSFQGEEPNYFHKWVNARLVYPDQSRLDKSEGVVVLDFVIDKSGKLTDITLLESSGDSFLDGEAIRVVSLSPDWTPGVLKGKPVSVKYTFSVIFRLKIPESATTKPSLGRSFRR